MLKTKTQMQHWLRTCIVVVAVGCLLLLTLVGVAAAIGRGVLQGPEFHVDIGQYHAIAFTTSYPDCMSYSAGCAAASRQPKFNFYTFWIVTVTKIPVPGGILEQFDGKRLLRLQVAP